MPGFSRARFLIFCMCFCVSAAYAQNVPSGQKVELFEVLIDEVGKEIWVRFRFLAPMISLESQGITYERAATDLEYLCENLALPYLQDHQLAADKIVISLASEKIEFGSVNPAVTQFFDLFRIENQSCRWEAF